MAIIQIKDISLKAGIGIQDWERAQLQDIIVNITMEYDASLAGRSDDIKDAVDYQSVQLAVIRLVEASRFNLLEKMGAEILKVVMADKRIISAAVTIDKPRALQFARSVSLTMSAKSGEIG